MVTKRLSQLARLIFLLLLIVEQATGFYIKDGDRVVFYGDSITEQNLYTAFVETYILTRFPRLSVSFINSGWSGDWVVGGGGGKIDERLRRDVFAHKPTVMTVMVGMNDGTYQEFDPAYFKVYSEGYERMLTLLKDELPQLRITLLQPSPFDDWTDSHAWRLAPPVKSGYNAVMARYGQFVAELAKERNLAVADMNALLVEVIRKAQTTDPALAQKIIPDRIHPAAAGHLLMAMSLLKSWDGPATVTAVELDAQSTRILSSENTKIAALSTGDKISWTQTDMSLPLPLDMKDAALALVVRLSDVVESLNQQPLKVKNLSAPRYSLKIDGEEIGIWTKEQLTAGINLAVLPTPMLKQAFRVHELTLLRNRIRFVRWREVQVPFDKENTIYAKKTLDALDALEADIIKRQHAAAAPRPHQYELIPQR
ncbi:MAG: SGNH/GDSL hydrolase family protein [Blastocatellia bacterium]